MFNAAENFKLFIDNKGFRDRIHSIIKKRGYSTIDEFLGEGKPIRYIDNLGTWALLKERDKFWVKIHKEWKDIVRNKIEQKPLEYKSIW